MGKRLPTILGKAIDDVIRTLNEQVSLFSFDLLVLATRYNLDFLNHVQ